MTNKQKKKENTSVTVFASNRTVTHDLAFEKRFTAFQS